MYLEELIEKFEVTMTRLLNFDTDYVAKAFVIVPRDFLIVQTSGVH